MVASLMALTWKTILSKLASRKFDGCSVALRHGCKQDTPSSPLRLGKKPLKFGRDAGYYVLSPSVRTRA